ncbi:unnamed protein product [Prorocentrum cordatum]|uniref:Uncharacterized protein n=1 Tax=Prorocentrum cordatum TaxID=2364126 RepID=A0ABN9R0E1_9DINO|nr:unnamed protein product [Polarella glacialis]
MVDSVGLNDENRRILDELVQYLSLLNAAQIDFAACGDFNMKLSELAASSLADIEVLFAVPRAATCRPAQVEKHSITGDCLVGSNLTIHMELAADNVDMNVRVLVMPKGIASTPPIGCARSVEDWVPALAAIRQVSGVQGLPLAWDEVLITLEGELLDGRDVVGPGRNLYQGRAGEVGAELKTATRVPLGRRTRLDPQAQAMKVAARWVKHLMGARAYIQRSLNELHLSELVCPPPPISYRVLALFLLEAYAHLEKIQRKRSVPSHLEQWVRDFLCGGIGVLSRGGFVELASKIVEDCQEMFNKAVSEKHKAWVKFARDSFQRGASRVHDTTKTQSEQRLAQDVSECVLCSCSQTKVCARHPGADICGLGAGRTSTDSASQPNLETEIAERSLPIFMRVLAGCSHACFLVSVMLHKLLESIRAQTITPRALIDDVSIQWIGGDRDQLRCFWAAVTRFREGAMELGIIIQVEKSGSSSLALYLATQRSKEFDPIYMATCYLVCRYAATVPRSAKGRGLQVYGLTGQVYRGRGRPSLACGHASDTPGHRFFGCEPILDPEDGAEEAGNVLPEKFTGFYVNEEYYKLEMNFAKRAAAYIGWVMQRAMRAGRTQPPWPSRLLFVSTDGWARLSAVGEVGSRRGGLKNERSFYLWERAVREAPGQTAIALPCLLESRTVSARLLASARSAPLAAAPGAAGPPRGAMAAAPGAAGEPAPGGGGVGRGPRPLRRAPALPLRQHALRRAGLGESLGCWLRGSVLQPVAPAQIVGGHGSPGAAGGVAAFEAPGMPGQAPIRHRPLSGELLDSEEEGAWLPDPIAHEGSRARGGREAEEARLFGWDELMGTWVEHLLTAIDVAILGDRVPTLLILADRNGRESQQQVEALKRFKLGVHGSVRVFVLYLHEFDWLFQAWEVKELPRLLFFGAGGADGRHVVPGPLEPEAIAEAFSRRLAVDLSWADFDPKKETPPGAVAEQRPREQEPSDLWHRGLRLLRGWLPPRRGPPQGAVVERGAL